MKKTNHTNRAGVVLLVVLGLLALFALVGVTFVMTAGQYKNSTTKMARLEQTDDPPDALLHNAMGQVLYGTDNIFSVIGPHSLLEDIYGQGGSVVRQIPNNGFAALTPAYAPGRGSMMYIANIPLLDPSLAATNPLAQHLNPTTGHYIGRVITMLDGPAAGHSSRITGYLVDTTTGTAVLRLLPFPGMQLDTGSNGWQNQPPAIAPEVGNRFLINGREFNGPGLGYNPTTMDRDPLTGGSGFTGLVDFNLGAGTAPVALTPNPRSPLTAAARTPMGQYLANTTVPKFANESYDAVDFQNMLLAYRDASSGLVPIPSLHRPALLNFWMNSGSWNADVERMTLLRPSYSDHPVFVRSINPNLPANPATGLTQAAYQSYLRQGPWDVDNDGDGRPDSIWVDLGMPARTDRLGRMVKPLFAIMCIDMDGKPNINAWGNLNNPGNASPVRQRTIIQVPQAFRSRVPTLAGFPTQGAIATLSNANLSVGAGLSPADASLSADMTALTGTPNDYIIFSEAEFLKLAKGVNSAGGRRLDGRYGEGFALAASSTPLAGRTGFDDNEPAEAQRQTAGATVDLFKGNAFTMPEYGGPMDFKGMGNVVLDFRGQPIYTWNDRVGANFSGFDTNNNGTLEASEVAAMLVNEPTQMNLNKASLTGPAHYTAGSGGETAADNPFGMDELEWILRPFDVDTSSGSPRISLLCPNFSVDLARRRDVTTESWHTPTVHFTPTPEIRQGMVRYANGSGYGATDARRPRTVDVTIMDMVRGKLKAVNPAASNAQVDTMLNNMIGHGIIAPELIMGLPLDINRPFGNSFDDDGNGVVDDEANEVLFNSTVVGNIPIAPNYGRQARQSLAEQLYLLMMLVKPDDYADPSPSESLTLAQRKDLTARRLAQWAINVVDFRDRDAVMTPFEYDSDPFRDADGDGDPWDVDDNPNTTADSLHRRLVWGCETPDLLLTETVAFHDRRVQNLPPGMRVQDMPMGDDDYDQTRVPQGSFFCELYCPRNPHLPPHHLSGDLYDTSGRLRLGLRSLNNTGQYPVWRVVIGESHQQDNNSDIRTRSVSLPDSTSLEVPQSRNPADPNATFSQLPNTKPAPAVTIDRIIWFYNPGSAPQDPLVDYDRIYYNRDNNPDLAPGQYLVVGPRQKTFITNTTGTQELRINGGTFQSTNSPTTYPTVGSDIKAPLAIRVQGGRPQEHTPTDPSASPIEVGISVSEPLFNTTTNPARYYDIAGVNQQTTLPDSSTVYDAFANAVDTPFDERPNTPLERDNLFATGTRRNYKTVVLQRLANPKLEWNPEQGHPNHNANVLVNPYISIDWLPVDLTVYNSEASMNPPAGEEDPKDMNPTAGDIRLRSRERGAKQPPLPPAPELYNLWAQYSDDPLASNGGGPGNFTHRVHHTFGYLNESFGTPRSTSDAAPDPLPSPLYVGDPKSPFPWITWNNRPYISNMELLNVPATSPSRLLYDFSLRRSTNSQHYQDRPNDKPSTPYGHLLNFFHSGNSTLPSTAAPDYHRALAMVDVPSRFSGTKMMFDPRLANLVADTSNDFFPYHAPNNYFSNYREPGRLNLNTISDQGLAWMGVTNRFDPGDNVATMGFGSPQFYNQVVDISRRGPAGATGNNSIPTFFSKPFVPQAESYYVPIPGMRMNGATPRDYVDGGLLRNHTLATQQPLFAIQTNPAVYNPLIGKDFFNDTDRNAYFRYQGLTRLSNLVTTRSNVYAVWITVGYFEVRQRYQGDTPQANSPAFDERAYPDGYELLAEAGSETGEVERHRAFYIIDRSIPVGFQRGMRHNAMDAVRLQRIIE